MRLTNDHTMPLRLKWRIVQVIIVVLMELLLLPFALMQPTRTPSPSNEAGEIILIKPSPEATLHATTMAPTFPAIPAIPKTLNILDPTDTPTLSTNHFVLSRPILKDNASDKIDWPDRTYPYGGTQFGRYQVHLGVDFWNKRFTPVHASEDGIVIYAGRDDQIQFGPVSDFYGNLVVIEHSLFSMEQEPIYTLYGHLETLNVETGQLVTSGDKIGQVGDSGVAIGPHLHFEVRVGDVFDFTNTRNPELWIENYFGFGALAGRVMNNDSLLADVTVLIRSDLLSTDRQVFTYADERVNSDIFWQENFATSDLPEGRYEVIVRENGRRILYREIVMITAGETTFVEINV